MSDPGGVREQAAPVDLDVHLMDIVEGDVRSFGLWFAAAEPVIRRSLSSFAARVDTECVVQEAGFTVWTLAVRIRPDGRPNTLLRYAVRCARNLAIDQVRRNGLIVVDTDVDEPEDGISGGKLDYQPDPLLVRILEGCLERLPPKPAEAIRTRLSGGVRSDHEIADSVGMRLNTLLQNIARARRLLKACLQEHDVDLEEYGL